MSNHEIMSELRCSFEGSELVLAARRAALRSHSPYSRCRVGAALVDAAGHVTLGTNVENASYGLTICAERCGMFAHVAAGRPPARMLAVSCPDGDPADPASLMPCGACRQVMRELLAPDAVVLVDHVGQFTLDDLLPSPFRPATPASAGV